MNMKKLNILLSSAKTGFALRLQNTNFWCFHKLAANDCIHLFIFCQCFWLTLFFSSIDQSTTTTLWTIFQDSRCKISNFFLCFFFMTYANLNNSYRVLFTLTVSCLDTLFYECFCWSSLNVEQQATRISWSSDTLYITWYGHNKIFSCRSHRKTAKKSLIMKNSLTLKRPQRNRWPWRSCEEVTNHKKTTKNLPTLKQLWRNHWPWNNREEEAIVKKTADREAVAKMKKLLLTEVLRRNYCLWSNCV